MNRKEMLVSFIIPAYNSSDTIVRCLNSIYTLTLDMIDYEVIIIDDCSKDNTVAIVEEYVKQHTNITLLCNAKNYRQGAARNRGISVAKGEYIIFVDSDDESAEGVVEALNLAEKYRLDMVAMHNVSIDDCERIIKNEQIALDGIFSGIELQTKHPFWFTGSVSYVYRASFLRQVNYPFFEGVLYEDTDFVNVHLYYANRVMYSNSCAYIVHNNPTSTTHTITYEHVADYLFLGTRMLKLYHSMEDQTSTYALNIREGGRYNIWMSCKRLFKLSSTADIHEFYNRIDSFIGRTTLVGYYETKNCWKWWVILCMKHRNIAIILAAIGQYCYKLAMYIKLKLTMILSRYHH